MPRRASTWRTSLPGRWSGYRQRPDQLRGVALSEPRHVSLLCGEAGILLTAYRVAPRRALADDLYALVRANAANEAEELMWGSPGTLVAARYMLA